MSFSKAMAARLALLLGALGAVAVVAAVMFMQGDGTSAPDRVTASTGATHIARDCPFATNYVIVPEYTWGQVPNTLLWYLTITPVASVREAGQRGFHSAEPVAHGWQAFYRFSLGPTGSRRSLISPVTFSTLEESVSYAMTTTLGRRPSGLRYNYSLDVWLDGSFLCRIEANHEAAVPDGLDDFLAQQPTPAPTRTVPPTQVPDCSISVASQASIDNHQAWVRPYLDGGSWRVEILWEDFASDDGRSYSIAANYLVGVPGQSTWVQDSISEDRTLLVMDWHGGTEVGQTYQVTLGIYGRNGCLWGEKVVEFEFPPPIDDALCDGNAGLEAVSWGYWTDRSRLKPFVKFELVDWAEYYLVEFDWGGSDIMKVAPSADEIAAGDMIVEGNRAYTSSTAQGRYSVWVMPMSATCMGKRVLVECVGGNCPQLGLATPAPTLAVTPGSPGSPGLTPGLTPGSPGSPGLTPGLTPGVTPLPTLAATAIPPTPVARLPGDPVVWPDPVDYWKWKSNPESGGKPGHYRWCYNGGYDSKMDDYYASTVSIWFCRVDMLELTASVLGGKPPVYD